VTSYPGISGGDPGGKLVEIRGGESDGTTFFVAEHTIIVDSFDGATTQPVPVNGDEREIFAYLTFLGKLNDSRESSSVTLIFASEGLMALARGARRLWTNIPDPYRRR